MRRSQNGAAPGCNPRGGEDDSGQDAAKHSRTPAAGKPRGWRLDTDGSTVRLVGPRGELVLLALECINPVDGDLDRLLRRLVVVGEQYRIAEVELRGLTIAVANLLVGNRGSA